MPSPHLRPDLRDPDLREDLREYYREDLRDPDLREDFREDLRDDFDERRERDPALREDLREDFRDADLRFGDERDADLRFGFRGALLSPLASRTRPFASATAARVAGRALRVR